MHQWKKITNIDLVTIRRERWTRFGTETCCELHYGKLVFGSSELSISVASVQLTWKERGIENSIECAL